MSVTVPLACGHSVERSPRAECVDLDSEVFCPRCDDLVPNRLPSYVERIPLGWLVAERAAAADQQRGCSTDPALLPGLAQAARRLGAADAELALR